MDVLSRDADEAFIGLFAAWIQYEHCTMSINRYFIQVHCTIGKSALGEEEWGIIVSVNMKSLANVPVIMDISQNTPGHHIICLVFKDSYSTGYDSYHKEQN